jgi:hypothetical protein
MGKKEKKDIVCLHCGQVQGLSDLVKDKDGDYRCMWYPDCDGVGVDYDLLRRGEKQAREMSEVWTPRCKNCGEKIDWAKDREGWREKEVCGRCLSTYLGGKGVRSCG